MLNYAVDPAILESFVPSGTENEPYRSAPMRHVLAGGSADGTPRSAEYTWRLGRDWAGLHVGADGVGTAPDKGSEAKFLTEHDEFARVLAQPVTSAFIADGSAVSVGWPSRLRTA
jgi:hypothetical protein